MFFPLLTALLAASLPLTSASPLRVPSAPERRAVSSTACTGAPAGSLANASNIRLVAHNTTGPDTTPAGTPLVVSDVWQVHGDEGLLLALATSEPYDDDPYLALLNGALLAYPASGGGGAPASASTPQPGAELVLSKPVPAQPDETFCAVLEAGKTVLAVNGDAVSWSLCPSTQPVMTGTPVYVVYKPAADNDGSYVFEECYGIQIGVEFVPAASARDFW